MAFANKTSSEIYVDLEKVHSLKRVLYIAAHPDDENTRALAWFSLDKKAETAYLSLTRGDGGQNLIGDELSEDLGVLRTQELLAARSIDRANQYFSRAVDFGYSKSAEESFDKWGKAEILSDVVLVIRQFKPDVIITRFPPDKRAGHGHHTASALLALEAFEKAADPNYKPGQVAQFGAWKTTSVYWNTSIWWGKDIEEEAKNNPKYLIQDIGGYNPLLGQSYNEIGTHARSQHKCQGFGAIIERGSRLEYFEHMAGKQLENDFFEENKRSWSKLISAKFSEKFNTLLANFDFVSPEKNVPALLEIRKVLAETPASQLDHLKSEKLNLLDQVIINCMGIYMEIIAEDYAFTASEEIKVSYQLTNRSDRNVQLMGQQGLPTVLKLNPNETITQEHIISNQSEYTTPYWLKAPFTTVFDISNPADLGAAESQPTYQESLILIIEGQRIEYTVPVTYKWRDPSYGERRRAVIAAPDYTVNLDQKSIILKPGQEKEVRVKIHAYKENLNTTIKVTAPDGWTVSSPQIKVNSTKKHEETWATVTLKAGENAKRGKLLFEDESGNPLKALTEITYDHIPTQVIFKPAILECVSLNAEIIPGKVAYIKGAGDAVPQAIAQLGFEVEEFEVSDLSAIDLKGYQSVVLGIRIYNVAPELHNFDQKLFDYVAQGGNLIMQYNTASRSAADKKFGPLPFELSRKRVTEEDAAVKFLAPAHQIMTTPNKLNQDDFKDWVQERGLYFAANWDDNYTPLFAWHDKGEEDLKGALIVAQHGKGQFVYTGISFFRELPNGVEGAYRLFANLLSYQP